MPILATSTPVAHTAWAGREHELVIGASASNSRWRGKDYGSPIHANGRVVDFWNFDGNFAEPDWGKPTRIIDETTRQTAGYMAARFNLTDDLNVFLGSRVANYWLTGDNNSTETGKVVPYAGVHLRPERQLHRVCQLQRNLHAAGV
ncbi:MAG: TonB-dependent receptor [Pseudomonas veronii]|nr:TonB-dependent receptor [Pseudomonas veronii]